jgi:hypothetical protein
MGRRREVFVVLLSAVVDHGDMKRKGNSDGSRRCGSKHEFTCQNSVCRFKIQLGAANGAISSNINFIHRFLMIRLSVVHRCRIYCCFGLRRDSKSRTGSIIGGGEEFFHCLKMCACKTKYHRRQANLLLTHAETG